MASLAKITLTCKGCGRSFEKYRSDVMRGEGHYCSMACRTLRVACTCGTCGKTFTEQPARIADGRGKYCSRECAYKSHMRTIMERADGTALVQLTKGYTAVIDAADIPIVRVHSWCAKESNGLYYPAARIDGRTVKMHQVLLDIPDGMEGDHKDGDTMNNRRSNLRICTHADNMKNTGPRSGRRFKGVLRGPRGNYIARIKGQHLGTFTSEEEAARAYDAAAIARYGEFARTNFSTGKAS